MAALLARQAAQALRAKQTVRIILTLSALALRFQIPRNLLADSQIKGLSFLGARVLVRV